MNPDRPVASLKEDGFNYYPLAKQLAPHLLLSSSDPSLVAGIEAPWGCGKTSFLNLTKLALNALEKAPLIFDYCPWVYSTVDALIVGFCVQIAAQLSKTSRQVSAELSLHADTTKSAADGKSCDVSEIRQRVQKALDEEGKPVVIFIDDADRLPPAQLHHLLQFLKTVADFRGVSYVIAYAAATMEQALSVEGKTDGREYLKKFIQLPVRLPRLSRLSLRKFVSASVSQLQQQGTGGAISAEEWRGLHECTTSDLVLDCLHTPRDVIRCFNLLSLRLPDISRKIHLSELLKFTILDLLASETVDFVRRNSPAFLGPLQPPPDLPEDHRSYALATTSSGSHHESARDAFSKTLERPTRSLLDSLFPANANLGQNVPAARCPHGLVQLLYGGATPMAFSIAEAETVLRNPSRHESIQEKVSAGVFREWVYFLSSVTDGARISDPSGFASELIDAANQAAAMGDDSTHGIRQLVAEYLAQVLAQLTIPEEAVLFVEEIISHWESLQVSHDVILELARDAGLWENGKSVPIKSASPATPRKFCIPAERIPDLEQHWRGIVRMQADNDTLHKQPHLLAILHRWGQFPNNDYAEPQKYLIRFSEQHDPLLLLQRPSGGGIDVSLLENIPGAHQAILSGMSKHIRQSELREMTANMIRQLQAQAANQPAAPVSRGEFGSRE